MACCLASYLVGCLPGWVAVCLPRTPQVPLTSRTARTPHTLHISQTPRSFSGWLAVWLAAGCLTGWCLSGFLAARNRPQNGAQTWDPKPFNISCGTWWLQFAGNKPEGTPTGMTAPRNAAPPVTLQMMMMKANCSHQKTQTSKPNRQTQKSTFEQRSPSQASTTRYRL